MRLDPVLTDPVMLAIYALALASVTRLVTGADTLTERANGWVIARFEALESWSIETFDNTARTAGWFVIKGVSRFTWFVTKVLVCGWCASFWLALPMLWGAPHWRHPIVFFLALALAMRQFVGTIMQIGR